MLRENLITPKRIKIVLACFLLFSVAAITHALTVSLSRAGKIAVEVKYAPFEASVFIDDRNNITNNAVNYLEPGTHHVTVIMDGFKTLEQDVEVNEDTRYIYGSLESLSADSSEVYRKYQEEYGEIEGISGEEATQEAEKLVNKWPILAYLPYIADGYTIGSILEDQSSLTVIVRAQPGWLNGAINRLRSFRNINLSSYNITIADFNNALAGKFAENSSPNPISFLENGYQGLSTPHRVNEGGQIDDYYYATISVGGHDGYSPTTYRAILQKTGNSWHLTSDPQLVFTVYNTPGLDGQILNEANQMDVPTNIQF